MSICETRPLEYVNLTVYCFEVSTPDVEGVTDAEFPHPLTFTFLVELLSSALLDNTSFIIDLTTDPFCFPSYFKNLLLNAEISEDISRTVYFDRIEDGEYYLGDEKVLEIQGRYYFTAPVKANAKKYRIASVCFVTGGKRYDYILEEDNVRVGDKVIVIANDEEKEVTVMDIREKTEAELVLPLKKYKKIQRKSS